jgi:hypothetical protein
MKKLIRLTESDLHRIVKESVNKVLCNEGFGDKFRGAVHGFKTGANQQAANDEDANTLWMIRDWAEVALQNNNPQMAMKVLQNILNWINHHKDWQGEKYGNNLTYSI